MKKRLIISALLASIILISIAANASAITGRLGNSRMILNLDVGEEVRRYLLVQNVNDVAITIELIASGDLMDSVTFEDNSFILQPGEEKKAYFTIKADKAGTTETKVNVMFKPPQGSGVGLSANIIIVTGGESEDDEEDDGSDAGDSEDGEDGGFSFNPTGGTIVQDGEDSFKFNPVTILAVSTAILVIIFIILVIYSGKSSKKKRSRRPRD